MTVAVLREAMKDWKDEDEVVVSQSPASYVIGFKPLEVKDGPKQAELVMD